MKPYPTKSKPRKAKKKPYVPIQLDGCEQRLADAVYQNELKHRGYKPKPSPRQPVKGARRGKIGAEVVYAPKCELSGCFVWSWPHGPYTRPVLVLDLSDEARERRRVKVGETIQRWMNGYALPAKYETVADAVLAAIGFTTENK